MATKSLIDTVAIDVAKKSHNCQANARHRINSGDSRLKVKNGLGHDHYCVDCAKKIISADIQKLTRLLQSLP